MNADRLRELAAQYLWSELDYADDVDEDADYSNDGPARKAVELRREAEHSRRVLKAFIAWVEEQPNGATDPGA